MDPAEIQRLIELDHAHVWHPFTPMRQWRQAEPIIIEAAEGDQLIDVRGKRYIDGVSSLWCNIHGHRVPAIDHAIRDQLDKVAHTTMLGLANVPATQLAAKLVDIAPGALSRVFYSDAGATATEVAFKMAIGRHYHLGRRDQHVLVAIEGAYHGDTTGSMSVGYSDLFHRAFARMVFHTETVPAPDTFHTLFQREHTRPGGKQRLWSLEDERHCEKVRETALAALSDKLRDLGERCAGVVIEPLVQGAAGLIMQPPGYLKAVAEMTKQRGLLLIADEVATGFGRTGRMFACEHEHVEPDILCLAKGLSGGYLPLAATLCTDEIAAAFEGELDEHRTLYHGHTYTGNPLGCAAALASINLFEQNDLLAHVRRKAALLAEHLDDLRDIDRFGLVADVRQRGLMVAIELSHDGAAATGFDPSRRLGYDTCAAARSRGALLRPLGNTLILMPPLAITDQNLKRLAHITLESITEVGRGAR